MRRIDGSRAWAQQMPSVGITSIVLLLLAAGCSGPKLQDRLPEAPSASAAPAGISTEQIATPPTAAIPPVAAPTPKVEPPPTPPAASTRESPAQTVQRGESPAAVRTRERRVPEAYSCNRIDASSRKPPIEPLPGSGSSTMCFESSTQNGMEIAYSLRQYFNTALPSVTCEHLWLTIVVRNNAPTPFNGEINTAILNAEGLALPHVSVESLGRQIGSATGAAPDLQLALAALRASGDDERANMLELALSMNQANERKAGEQVLTWATKHGRHDKYFIPSGGTAVVVEAFEPEYQLPYTVHVSLGSINVRFATAAVPSKETP